MLKDAAGLRLLRSVEARVHTFLADDHKFTRLHFALIIRANQIEGTGFRRKDDAVGAMCSLAGNAAHHQWPETARITRGKNAVGGEHDERECALKTAERISHGVRQRLLPRARDQVNDDLGVAGGLEDRTRLLQLRPYLQRI